MPIKLGVSLLARFSRIRASMARRAPAESAMTARSLGPFRFAALARSVIRRFHPGRCTSKVSRFAHRFAECRSTPASISKRLMRRASADPSQVSALPIAISRVATTVPTSCARPCVRRALSGQLLPRWPGRNDQTERLLRAGKSVSDCETGAWPSMSDLRLANSPAQKSRNVRTRAVLRRSG